MGIEKLELKDTNPKWYAVREGLKEVSRYLISVGIVNSLIIVFQIIQSGINTQTGEVAVNWQMVASFSLFSLVGAVIRALDKAKHEYGKITTDSSGVSKGILPW